MSQCHRLQWASTPSHNVGQMNVTKISNWKREQCTIGCHPIHRRHPIQCSLICQLWWEYRIEGSHGSTTTVTITTTVIILVSKYVKYKASTLLRNIDNLSFYLIRKFPYASNPKLRTATTPTSNSTATSEILKSLMRRMLQPPYLSMVRV